MTSGDLIGLSGDVSRADELEIRALFNRVIAASGRLPLAALATVGLSSISRNFRDRGRPNKWRSLSEGTLVNRRHGGDAPLQDTGHLRRSVSWEPQGRADLRIGTKVRYGVYQQFGTGIYGESGQPYVIRAKNAGALAFRVATQGPVAPSAGSSVSPSAVAIRRSVIHPGVVARPFVMWQNEDGERIIDITWKHIRRAGRR